MCRFNIWNDETVITSLIVSIIKANILPAFYHPHVATWVSENTNTNSAGALSPHRIVSVCCTYALSLNYISPYDSM